MPIPKSKTSHGGTAASIAETSSNYAKNTEREAVFNAFRQWGYLEGDLDPLGFLRPRPTPELQIESEYAAEARAIYSSTIGVEINHIYAPERRRWIYEQMESSSQGFEITEKDQRRIRSPVDIFARFEDVDPRSILGGGDVKYHMGATGEFPPAAAAQSRCISSRTRAISKPSIRWPWAAPALVRIATAVTASTASCPSSSTATRPSPARESGPKP
jgi:2-oxoglutarate dehydrogenase complex dehydrogenase (E1) component-like enzyme